MKKKGFATTAVMYTFLLLFLVLLIGILNNSLNRKTILDQLKSDTKQELENSEKQEVVCAYEIGQTWEFAYQTNTADGIQEFKVPCNGTYKLEVYGAQGNNSSSGGKGGYSYGNIKLNPINTPTLYVVVGGQSTGYNGGGSSGTDVYGNSYYNGGGATHIALVSGTLADIGYESFITNKNGLIVAGGGGGSSYAGNSANMRTQVGGAGGGETGGTGTSYPYAPNTGGAGGNQSTGASFGKGGNSSGTGGGGGGGLYGGYNGGSASAGGGGSGYIDGVTDGATIAGNQSMPTHDGSGTMTGNTGNGYAKITLVSLK